MTTLETLLTTPRLMIRPLRREDVTSRYVEALNDPEVVGMTEARHVAWDPDRVLEYVEQMNCDGVSQLWGVFLKDSGQHIGNIRLFNFHPTHRRAELSIMIFDRACWSRGYATEAMRAVTDFAFERLGLHRICADYYATNRASARLFAKAGFAVEGVFRDHFHVDGGFVDSVRVGKLRDGTARRTA